MNNSADTHSDLRARRATVVVIGAVLALLSFNVATASAAGSSTTFVFGDGTFTSKIEPVTSYELSYSNNNSCQPLRVTETTFNPSWPRIESDVSTSTPITRAQLDVNAAAGKGKLVSYKFGSPMMFLTATQSGTGATEKLTFTMKFNSVTIKGGGSTTTIDCFAP